MFPLLPILMKAGGKSHWACLVSGRERIFSQHKTMSNQQETLFNQHQTMSKHQETMSIQHKTMYSQHQILLNQHKTTCSKHKTMSNHQETLFNQHQTMSNHLRNTVQPAPNNVQPAQNTVQPAPNNVHPPRNIVQPARNHVQQAQNNVQPAGHHVQSSRNNFQPAGHYVRHDIYHNYGPPVLDLSEDDLYANYASEYAQTNSNATTEQVQQGAEWPPSPIINISSDHQEEEESDDELEDDVPELVDLDPNDRQYHEQYDSYREDVTEHNWTDDASTTSRSSSVNGAPDRGGNRSDEADVDVENVYTSSNGHNAGRSGGENRYAGHAGWPVQAHSSTTNHENYQNAALANRRAAVGNPCGLYGYGFESIHAAHRAQYEASTPGVDLTQASFSGFGQRRHREYTVGQSDEAGWNKRPRTDGNGSAFRRVSRSIGPGADTVASENRHLHPPPAHRQLPAPILPPREPMIFPQQVSNSSEGSRRTSARLLGIDPPPSTIRNVAVPPSTGELLDRLASGEEEDSDDPSWDSGSDDSN
ncbi:hypothetical protein EGW08_004614 [Elysia chlorotica]|uniref:Uncharacterized protein n=1 Tax=Elysia chlorotica TaxID=188477 RepID=A0A3S1HWN2_ELYCH|nr:hypothetical protein EGW08_004614 [Elysia chlorotica]